MSTQSSAPPALLLLVLVLAGSGCAGPDPSGGTAEVPPGGNILLLIADDLGNDKVGVYDEHPIRPSTPNIDRLASRGVLFRNAYAYASCSATRAAILTGRWGRRTGLGKRFNTARSTYELPLHALTLAELVDRSEQFEYDRSLVGKWHLAGRTAPSGFGHAGVSGFDWYAGSFANIEAAFFLGGAQPSYYHWEKVTNGEPAVSRTYATTDTVDDAIRRIETMGTPWLLWVAFNAPHLPLHLPPADLHHHAGLDESSSHVEKYHAAVEAMDSEIGRLLDSIDAATRARTTIIFVGDNGTPSPVTLPPRKPRQGKSTLYEGGVNVPLIVAGPGVRSRGSECGALVHAVDIYATVADLAGVALSSLEDREGARLRVDGISLLPYLEDPQRSSYREFLYLEHFGPPGPPPYDDDRRAVRDTRYKLVRSTNRPEALYDLQGRFDDGPNLLGGTLDEEQAAAHSRLATEMDRIERELRYEGF